VTDTVDEILQDPVEVVVRLVKTVERHLDEEDVRAVVCAVMGQRAGRRRLAQALQSDATVLRTGRPPAPYCVAKLLMALSEGGARNVSRPRCSGCDRAVAYVGSRSGGAWTCSPCSDAPTTCAGCGQLRRVVSRDRHGSARCAKCPDTAGDPLNDLVDLVTGLDPALTADQVHAALGRATVRPAGQRRLAWAVLSSPVLLTGAGHDAPTPAVLRFIEELVAVGATKIVRPACPRCHGVKALSKLLDGKRVCRACFARHAAVPCARCGAVREPATRDADGNPLCPNCLISDPANLEECVGCGRRKRVAVRTPDGPRCDNCRPKLTAECFHCGRTSACEMSQATGQPWCQRCQQRWATCSGCATTAPIRGGTWVAPLCAACTNPDPDFWGRCPACQSTWQLSPRPCLRCNLNERIDKLLSKVTGVVRADLAPFRDALANAERPDSTLVWLSGTKVSAVLEHISRDNRPLSHEVLDELPSGKLLAHLRSVLVATGALPARDERLVVLEAWIKTAVQNRTDPVERRILHGYAVWHHLRRLRRRVGDGHTTYLQALNVRCHVTAAGNFLDWLTASSVTIKTCTQQHLDQWIANPDATYHDETGHFVRWAVQHRHAAGLTFPAVRWAGPRGTLDTEKRWADARRLLHDDTLPTGDRVAGLLLLLYAQRIATISQLTVEHVGLEGDALTIRLGSSPVVLPEPLAGLVRQLVTTRRGKARIGTPDEIPWLFPGGRPGQPLGDDRLGQRLHAIGLRPQQDRSTALFALAAEIPAAVLARMLGIHIQVAVLWQKASAGDWSAYAAAVSQRTPS
jgi:hypothetical protein